MERYVVLTWEARTRLNDDAAKTNQQYLRPGDDDFDMEEEFFEKHLDTPHHADPIAEQVNALGRRQTVHRCKGKAIIRRRRLYSTTGRGSHLPFKSGILEAGPGRS